LGVGRLGEMRLEARGAYLLDHIAPARAALHCQSHPVAVGPRSDLDAQPTTEPLAVRLPDPALPQLARVELERLECDLPTMQIEPHTIATTDLLGRVST
jgi:hypothetical protein